MLYAVTIDPLNAIFFVSERPDGDTWEVQDGVSLDIPFNFTVKEREPDDAETILCKSTSDPRYYKLFKNTRDIDSDQFRSVGRRFGGLFSKPSWERFAKLVPAGIGLIDVSAEEPPGATERAVAAIKAGR
jgi:hypothetical protein